MTALHSALVAAGELVSRLGSDTMLIQQAATTDLNEVLMGFIKVTTAIALMFVISTKLTLIVFGVAVVLLALCVPFARWWGTISKDYQARGVLCAFLSFVP